MKSYAIERKVVLICTFLVILLLMIKCDPLPAQFIQYYDTHYQSDYRETYIPAAMMVTTFCVIHSMNDIYNTPAQRNQVAITGMVITVSSYFIINKIRKNHKHRRYGYH